MGFQLNKLYLLEKVLKPKCSKIIFILVYALSVK